MSTMQRLTLIGLYNYDSTLFDNLTLPSNYDKDTFINALLLEHGEKCVLYSNPTFLKSAIASWGNKWALELERIYDALSAEYDPIYNYDRYEFYKDTDDTDRTITDKPDYSNTQTNDYDVVTEQNTNSTNEHQTSAYNSSSYEPTSKDILNNGKSTTSNDGTITNKVTGTTQNIDDKLDRTFTHNAHLYGNIGVTTSAQMVTEIVQQRMKYNLYECATRLFANELLIGIF